jgi:hypothetical protein
VAVIDMVRRLFDELERGAATDEELRQARRELDETRESLEALRGSRLLRLTRPVRTLYYRLRG